MVDVETLVLGQSDGDKKPIFWNKFDRLLFLTATPFQLGHDELIRVLRSFAAAKWSGPAAPDGDRPSFLEELKILESRLNDNRKQGRRLDGLWSRIDANRVARHATAGSDLATAAANWWEAVEEKRGDPFDEEILAAVRQFIATKEIAQYDQSDEWASLRTWVIRHNRPTTLSSRSGESLG
jgi:hypothetical protein